MKIVGISMMKDESDICYWTVKHMMSQVDEVVVLDNNSTDNTAQLCREAGARVIHDPEVAYYQSKKTSNLAERVAREHGATWIIPFDADEIWYSTLGPIREVFTGINSNIYTVTAVLFNHIPTSEDPDESNPIKRIGWRLSTPGALPKVSCRYERGLVIEQGNHGSNYKGRRITSNQFGLGIRHFPYRSDEHFVQKVRNGYAAYQATDLGESVGAHWRGYGKILENQGEEALINNVFRKWFYSPDPKNATELVFDPAPAIF